MSVIIWIMIYDPERITFFAKTDARGQHVRFGIKAKDRTKHIYVIGKTGMGKSTLLENMAVQDIRNGEGLAFIDPHGQTAEKLLDYIPPERMKDVLYFAPFDMENPISFNVMEDVGPDKRHLVVSGLMSVFAKIWVDQWSARMEYILSNTLLALLEYPDSTLLSVNRMLSDKKYRDKVVDNVTDPSVKSFWVDEFAKYTDRFAAEATPAIQNKIGQFTANPLIRNIIGQPKSSFDIRKIMDERKILIINLSKGLVGETNANLLGSMLTTRIYLAAMSRADLQAEKMDTMPNFYFYVDEFQSFANSTFANILSEARKYKLNLTIAHQYIEQMEEEVRNAVFGNVGTIISFRVGPFDAEVLETIFSPRFLAADIVNLGFAQIYLTLMIDGIGSAPFSAVTLPPLEQEQVSYKSMVIKESRKNFASNRLAVEAAISSWHELGREEPTEKKPKNTNGNNAANANSYGKRPREENKPKREVSDTAEQIVHEHSKLEQQAASVPAQQQHVAPPVQKQQERPERPERVDDRKERNDHHVRPQQHASGPTVTQNPKHLEGLRSVLANISQKENTGENDTQAESKHVPHDRRNSKSEKKTQSRNSNDLKEALAAILKEKDASEQKNQPEEKKSESQAPVQETNKESEKQAESVRTEKEPTHDTTIQASENEKDDSSLDPKQLERMMRVTTSDKTPLK
ncbi:MAG: type IV secretion system DNA-binding domain-containing protein [Candidatus Paceibacterota bacterium]